MTIDWNYLFDVKVDELNDDKADVLYSQLIEFNARDEENVQRLRKLFDVCKSIMQIKTVQAEVAVEELEETVKKYDKNETELLRKELAIFKQSDTGGENIAQKLSKANDQILELKNTIESKDNESIKMKRKFNDLQNSLDLRDREVSALRSEVESLRDEMENQRQVDDQFIERQEPIEKLREKNKQIQRLLDELRDVETINLELTNQTKRLKLELNSATNELELSCNQMEMLAKQMRELNLLNEDFLTEKQFLLEENHKLKESLNRYESGDENIIDKYIENIKDLQNLIQLKDEEIIKLKSLSLIPDEEMKEKQKRMSKVVEEKDKQIDLLKSQLNEAVVDMESQTEIIQKLVQQSSGDKEVYKLREKVVSLTNQLKSIEEEVLTKDEELLALRKRINTYERGEYGLRDALKEINDLAKHLKDRDQRIEEMVQQINQLKVQLNDAEDVIDGRHKDNYSEDERHRISSDDTETEVSDKTQRFSIKEKTKALEVEKQLLRLEDEKIDLTEKLRSSLNKSVVDKQEKFKEINALKERLKSVETENLELQLGLKEILNGIRETDSQSDVIIECPSLERVCRLLESRTISGDLTNIIALKAELDLVRGHNEQMRTDMRQLRNDYLKIISQYTQDLLESDDTLMESELNYYKDVNQIQANEWNKSSDSEKLVSNKEIIPNETMGGQQSETNECEEQTIDSYEKIFVNKESQTLPISVENNEKIEVKTIDNSSQTEAILESNAEQTIQTIGTNPTKTLCENCAKVIKIVEFLKNCVKKLEDNIRSSESKFAQSLQLLQREYKNLTDSLNKRLNEKDLELSEKEDLIISLKHKLTSNEMVPSMAGEESSLSEEHRLVRAYPNKSRFKSESQSQLSSSCKTVLESVINCLQARLEHKDESIRQYRHMLSEAKQNFENELIRLIDSNRESDEKSSINFTQMIDNEELQSALKSCVNELEICKSELNSKITELEEELKRNNEKLIAYQNENEDLRLKKNNPNSQSKQIIDQLREECKQKDLVINGLNKSIKDDRAMRAVSAVRRPKDESMRREKKVDNELFQEIADLRAVTQRQKESIKNSEVLKWDYEKNVKELKEQMRQKLKEKDIEIRELREKVDKIKVRLNKNESEKQLLQNKLTKIETNQRNSMSKSSQCGSTQVSEQELNKLKTELKKFKTEVKQRESEANGLKRDLELSRQTESELKTLLEESVKREKLATISEESTGVDTQYDRLLQENAQIKVELRMAEFELKRRSAP